MNKEYIFNSPTHGGKTKIILTDNSITISRPGAISKLSHGFVGDKTIMLNQISAIQLKKAGIARGYIQFIIAGARESKSGILGETNENIVYFDSTFKNKEINSNAEEIKSYIENYIAQQNNRNCTIIKSDDKYDQLKKLKQLLDDGIINQNEFDIEKEKILNENK